MFVCEGLVGMSIVVSWQYVNSKCWIVGVGEGNISVCVCIWAPIMHRLFGQFTLYM